MHCPKCTNSSNFTGHEVRGIYDGVLFWVCDVCDFAFQRNFTYIDLNAESSMQATKYNNRFKKE